MSTRYFSAAALPFLAELAANNTRAWFADNKARYEQLLRDPYLQLIADLQAPLATISTHYRADPRAHGGSLFRIYRDTRYAHDKSPYKSWAGARLRHERAREVVAPSFYLHLQPGHSFVGAGLWRPPSPSVKRIRDFLVANPAAWKAATRSPEFAQRFVFGGESLVRPPRGFDPGHELIDDLKRKDFTAWQNFPDSLVSSSELQPFLVQGLRGLAPMMDYLCASLDLEF